MPRNGGADRPKRVRISISSPPDATPPRLVLRKTMPVQSAAAGSSPLDAFLDTVYDAVLITDSKGRVRRANGRAFVLLETDRDGLIGSRIMDWIREAENDFLGRFEDLGEDRFAVIEASCERGDGESFPAEITLKKPTFDGDSLWFFIRNISRRIRTERLLRTILYSVQNSLTGIAVTERDGTLDYANGALRSLFDLPPEAPLRGQNIRDYLGGDPAQIDALFGAMTNRQESWTGELWVVRRNGHRVPVQVAASPNHNRSREDLGISFSFVDLTDQKKAEEAMRALSMEQAMSASLGAACHHLAQPATVLVTNAQLLKDAVRDKGHALCELAESGAAAADQLHRVIDQLNGLQFFRTRRYLDDIEDPDSEENTILDIGTGL
jgi:PAS domain S-box-containing protein